MKQPILRGLSALLALSLLLAGCATVSVDMPVDMPEDMTITVQTPGESAPPGLIRGFGVADQTAFTEVAVDENLVYEGATVDAYQTTLTLVDPTADRTITLPNSSGTVALNPAAGSIEFEGATADAYETTLTVVDPTADRTITLPDETGAVIMSSLATNGTGITNSVTGGTNLLVWEGATADAYETSLSVTDPTADRSIVIPDGAGTIMLSSLATNAAGAANAVTGGSNALIFEGSGVDAYEMTLSATNPTAARSVVLPDAGGTVMLSSLATNGADAANAVTGASNALAFEGATANDYETSITPTDPTADRTITLPNATGTVALISGATTLVVGSGTITGTATATHGLTTPLYALCSIANAVQAAAEALCSVVITTSTVTLNVWSVDGVTPGAAPALVYWQVAGTP